jgi:hypothetical protein
LLNPTLDRRLDDGALTEAGKALIEHRFRGLEDSPHALVPWKEAKLRLVAPFKR